jgi:hypothetical protein
LAASPSNHVHVIIAIRGLLMLRHRRTTVFRLAAHLSGFADLIHARADAKAT